jgi:tRNA nucleotidyltransferase (CCA-adding enzyme)
MSTALRHPSAPAFAAPAPTGLARPARNLHPVSRPSPFPYTSPIPAPARRRPRASAAAQPPAAAQFPAPAPTSSPPATAPAIARDTDIVLTHATCDFDSLAAAVGLALLRGPGTHVVMPAGEHPSVQRYLSLHRGLFPLLDLKAVDPARLRYVGVVDAHLRKRLGPSAGALLDAAVCVECVDHHSGGEARCDLRGDVEVEFVTVGAVTTRIVERLMERADIAVTPADATLFALAIHTDTGSLQYENTTPRDASALAWCLRMGACQRSIAQHARNYLDPTQQRLLSNALDAMTIDVVDGLSVASVVLESDTFVKGMAGVAQACLELSDVDCLLLAMMCPAGRTPAKAAGKKQVSIIGRARSRVDGVDYNTLFESLGGGGHAKAASASIKVADSAAAQVIVDDLVAELKTQLPAPRLVREFMSTNVRSIRASESMAAVRDLLFETQHTGLAVVVLTDEGEELAGVVSRQDVAMAERRGLLTSPVKGWIARRPICAHEDTPLHEAEALLADNKIGRLPVVRDGKVVGIVTRSDILVQRRLLSR